MTLLRTIAIIFLMVLFATSDGHAAASHVNACQSAVVFNATSVGCTITGFTAGNAVAIGVYWLDTTGTLIDISVSTCTGTVTVFDNPTQASSGSIFSASGASLSIGGGGNCTFTANFSESITEMKIWVHEVGGVQGGSIVGHLADADAFRNTTCTDCIPDVAGQLSITPTVDGAYFFGFMGAAVTAGISPGTDFTDGATDDVRGTAQYYIQPTAGAHATTFSRTDTTGQRAIALAVVLQPAATVSLIRGTLLGVHP